MSRKVAKLVKVDLSSKKLSTLRGVKSLDGAQSPLHLKLSGNLFETVPTTELAGLDVRVLNLSKNNIISLPEAISDMKQLEALVLSGNRLRHLGEELLALTNLKSLDLSGNQFTTVPPVLAQMVSLESLKLSKNLLHVLPTTITLLTNLQDLDISGNPLVSPPSDVVSKGTTAIISHLKEISNTIGATINEFTYVHRPPYLAEWIKPTPDSPTTSKAQPKTLFQVRPKLLGRFFNFSFKFLLLTPVGVQPTREPKPEAFDGHFYVSHSVHADQGCRDYMEDTYVAVNHVTLPATETKKKRKKIGSKLANSSHSSPGASERNNGVDEPDGIPHSKDAESIDMAYPAKLGRMASSAPRRSSAIPQQRSSSPNILLHSENGTAGESLALFSVFDGHAGQRCSKFLQENFAKIFFEQKATRQGEVPAGLYKAFHKAESQYCILARAQNWNDGSTGVVATIHGQNVILAHVGDSRAVLCRGKTAIGLTQDHKPDRQDEEERILALGGTVEKSDAGGSIPRVNGHLAVSRAFGDLRMKETNRFVSSEPEISVVPLMPEDKFIILASDGLWDVLTNQEAVDFIRRDPSQSKAAKNLVKRALKIGTSDNVTVLVIWLTWVSNRPLSASGPIRALRDDESLESSSSSE